MKKMEEKKSHAMKYKKPRQSIKPFRNELMTKLGAKKEVRYIRYFTILLHLFILR